MGRLEELEARANEAFLAWAVGHTCERCDRGEPCGRGRVLLALYSRCEGDRLRNAQQVEGDVFASGVAR